MRAVSAAVGIENWGGYWSVRFRPGDSYHDIWQYQRAKLLSSIISVIVGYRWPAGVLRCGLMNHSRPPSTVSIDMLSERSSSPWPTRSPILSCKRKRSATSENKADRFACALPMDDDNFAALIPQRPVLWDLVHLRSGWGVSIAALGQRTHQSGCLDDPLFKCGDQPLENWSPPTIDAIAQVRTTGQHPT